MGGHPDLGAVVVRFYEEFFNRRNFDALDECFAEDYRDVAPARMQLTSREALRDYFLAYIQRAPDLRVQVSEPVVQGDTVVVIVDWWSRLDRDKELLMGQSADFFRFRDGRIAEHWEVVDWDVMRRSLEGLSPSD